MTNNLKLRITSKGVLPKTTDSQKVSVVKPEATNFRVKRKPEAPLLDDSQRGKRPNFARENNNFPAAKQGAVSSSHNKETKKSINGQLLVGEVKPAAARVAAPKAAKEPCLQSACRVNDGQRGKKPKNEQQIKVDGGVGNKRKPEAPLLDDGQRGKRPKTMDRVLKIQCGDLLKELTSHRGAVKLKIPLGRIKKKLEGNAYFNADEFAHDVKLTFSKATTVGHTAHEMAKEIFCRRWRLLDQAKLKQMKKEDDDEKGDFVRRHVPKQAAVRETKSSSIGGLGEVKPARVAQKALGTAVQKERACPRVDRKKSVGGVARAKCPSCASLLACHCRQKKAAACAQALSVSGLSSVCSSENNHSGVEGSNRRSSSQETDGPGGIVIHEEEKSPPTEEEGWSNSLNALLSPSKALRAAMLKSRFADIIFRATHQSAAKSDPSRLEKEKQHEKARIEAEIKAAQAALRLKEQNDWKTKRERERAAAKKALQETERTVDLCGSLDIVNDVEMLSKATWLYESLGIDLQENGTKKKPLELLGLYLKVDKLQDESEDFEGAINNTSAEEGEIEEGEIREIEEGEILS